MASNSYHITPKGPRKCTVNGGPTCQYKGNPHANNQVDAMNIYEQQMNKAKVNGGNVLTYRIKDKDKSMRQKLYRVSDRFSHDPDRKPDPYVAQINSWNRKNPKTKKASIGSKMRKSMTRGSKRMIRKATRPLRPNKSKLKKWLLVKYWMPDIRSNKWK